MPQKLTSKVLIGLLTWQSVIYGYINCLICQINIKHRFLCLLRKLGSHMRFLVPATWNVSKNLSLIPLQISDLMQCSQCSVFLQKWNEMKWNEQHWKKGSNLSGDRWSTAPEAHPRGQIKTWYINTDRELVLTISIL